MGLWPSLDVHKYPTSEDVPDTLLPFNNHKLAYQSILLRSTRRQALADLIFLTNLSTKVSSYPSSVSGCKKRRNLLASCKLIRSFTFLSLYRIATSRHHTSVTRQSLDSHSTVSPSEQQSTDLITVLLSQPHLTQPSKCLPKPTRTFRVR